MKELYEKYFRVSEHGKIREKVMLCRTAFTVVVMVVCLIAMSVTAYAYFSDNVASLSNTITAASFDAQVTILSENNVEIPLAKEGDAQTVELLAGEYTVKLSPGESSAKTGFCVIKINDTEYCTAQIGTDVKRELADASVIFKLKISGTALPTKVVFYSHWGTSSYYEYSEISNSSYYVKNEGEINLVLSTDDNEEGDSASTPPVLSTGKPSQVPSATPPITSASGKTETPTPDSATEEGSDSAEKTETPSENAEEKTEPPTPDSATEEGSDSAEETETPSEEAEENETAEQSENSPETENGNVL